MSGISNFYQEAVNLGYHWLKKLIQLFIITLNLLKPAKKKKKKTLKSMKLQLCQIYSILTAVNYLNASGSQE